MAVLWQVIHAANQLRSMLAKVVSDLYKSVWQTRPPALQDTSDRLQILTTMILIALSAIISTKQYVFNAMSCYIPTPPSGDKFEEYLNDYCWVHGTIPLRPDERFPETDQDWTEYDATRRISKSAIE